MILNLKMRQKGDSLAVLKRGQLILISLRLTSHHQFHKVPFLRVPLLLLLLPEAILLVQQDILFLLPPEAILLVKQDILFLLLPEAILLVKQDILFLLPPEAILLVQQDILFLPLSILHHLDLFLVLVAVPHTSNIIPAYILIFRKTSLHQLLPQLLGYLMAGNRRLLKLVVCIM